MSCHMTENIFSKHIFVSYLVKFLLNKRSQTFYLLGHFFWNFIKFRFKSGHLSVNIYHFYCVEYIIMYFFIIYKQFFLDVINIYLSIYIVTVIDLCQIL